MVGRRRAVRVSAVALLLALTSCGASESRAEPAGPAPSVSSSSSAASSRTPSPTVSSAAPDPATGKPLVLVVSLDGLNPDALDTIGLDALPGFRRLIDDGASTLDARTAYERTQTLPNHTGMMTGLRVGGPTGHGTTMNEDDGRTLRLQNGRYVPGMFDVAHDHGLRTEMVVGKDKFKFLLRSWNGTYGARDRTGADDGRDKVDARQITPAPTSVRDVVRLIGGSSRPHLTFLHLETTDAAGHASGFLSPAYLKAVRTVDGYLVRLLDAIEAQPSVAARTTVIVTTDHGGQGRDHSDMTKEPNYTIPFFVWGAGVQAGADLYDLNPARTDPGDGRPTYAGAQPVRNMDVEALALRLLGLQPIAGTFGTGPEGALAIS